MVDGPPKAYGEGRIRSNVSYADVERAAIAILKAERRPTVETIREALGSGSPDTIATALRRFWRDLGARIEGDPAALTRMPPDIAELADGLWQRALRLAGEAAKHDDNAARERLKQIEAEQAVRAYSLELREKEWDAAARERERALADAREHLLLLSKSLGREQATIQARDARIADLETQISLYRQQIAALIAGAITQKNPRPRRTPLQSASTVNSRKPSPTKSRNDKPLRRPQNARKANPAGSPRRSTPKSSPRRT